MDMTAVLCYTAALVFIVLILYGIWMDVSQRTANLGETRAEYACNCENCNCREDEHVS